MADATVIREIPEDGRECSSISGVLRYCKRRILYPYLKLLGVMGLKPLNTDSQDQCIFSLLLNKVYIVLVTLLLLTGYSLQFLTCFRRDCGFNYKTEVFSEGQQFTDEPGNFLAHETRWNPNNDSSWTYENKTFRGDHSVHHHIDHITTTIGPEPGLIEDRHTFFYNICSGNVFYVHFLPSILHFIAFAYMLCLYWLNHDEQLQNLMERVFIQAAQAHSTFSKKSFLKTLKFLVFFGTLWLTFSTACLVLQILFSQIHLNYWPSVGLLEKQTLVSVLGLSTAWQDAIQVTVIISYCIHCHLLSIYLQFIHSRISQHSISLSECIKEIGEIDKLLRYINSELASGLLPLLMLDTMFSIGSVVFVLRNGPKMNLYKMLTSFIGCAQWILLVVLPLAQAAKLSTALKKVRELGHLVRMRPFGYQNYQQSDLDSFLLFVSTVKMDVRILKIPLTATNISVLTCGLTFLIFLWGYFQ